MSIDAIIEAVTVIAPGDCELCGLSGLDPDNDWDTCPVCHGAAAGEAKVRLKLTPRETGGVAGQSVLTIVDPPNIEPNEWRGLIGTEIWGNSSEIMVGDKLWAKRIGYTRISLY